MAHSLKKKGGPGGGGDLGGHLVHNVDHLEADERIDVPSPGGGTQIRENNVAVYGPLSGVELDSVQGVIISHDGTDETDAVIKVSPYAGGFADFVVTQSGNVLRADGTWLLHGVDAPDDVVGGYANPPNGSIYQRTNGQIYRRVGDEWEEIGGVVPYARVIKGAGQLIVNNGAMQTITFATEVEDSTGDMVNLGVNNDRITITRAGVYLVTAELVYEINAGIGYVRVQRFNAANAEQANVVNDWRQGIAAEWPTIPVACPVRCAVGDYLKVQGSLLNAGADHNARAASSFSATFLGS